MVQRATQKRLFSSDPGAFKLARTMRQSRHSHSHDGTAMVAFYNEMNTADGGVRPHYSEFAKWLQTAAPERLARKRA